MVIELSVWLMVSSIVFFLASRGDNNAGDRVSLAKWWGRDLRGKSRDSPALLRGSVCSCNLARLQLSVVAAVLRWMVVGVTSGFS